MGYFTTCYDPGVGITLFRAVLPKRTVEPEAIAGESIRPSVSAVSSALPSLFDRLFSPVML